MNRHRELRPTFMMTVDPLLGIFRLRNLFLGAALFALAFAAWSIYNIVHMPLKSYKGEFKPLSDDEKVLRQNLAAHVNELSITIGERNLDHYTALQSAADYIQTSLREFGYHPTTQTYTVNGRTVTNIAAQIVGTGKPEENIVIGAHYDSVTDTPGANDNASGVAAVLELARFFKSSRPNKTISFVFFANEEPPYFQTDEMGSLVYAKQLHQQGVHVAGMIAVETIGYYSDARGSQHYPSLMSLFYPDTGNFIAFVGDPESRDLLHRCVRVFRESTNFPSEGAAPPPDTPGAGWSDHWSFWQQGWPAIMATDTAPFRYRQYHRPQDTTDKLDFDKMARVVGGLKRVVENLATQP